MFLVLSLRKNTLTGDTLFFLTSKIQSEMQHSTSPAPKDSTCLRAKAIAGAYYMAKPGPVTLDSVQGFVKDFQARWGKICKHSL